MRAMKLHTQVVLGLFLGVIAGVALGADAVIFEPLGTLFIRLIRMVIVPLIAATLITAIASMRARPTPAR